MKHKKIYVALFATLGLMATGCQKESTEFLPDQTMRNVSMYIVEYSIDGEFHRAILQSEEEYNALLLRLMAIAREGYEVKVRNGSTNRMEGAAKEVVVYTTDDADDAAKWTKNMTDNGYEVSISYDDKTGIYTCIAIK